MSEDILKIENLCTYFDEKKVLTRVVDGVDIRVKKGEVVGIVGESGCGKSMTAMSIMGLLKNNAKIVSGSIKLLGKELTGLSKKELSVIRGSELSMVFQEPMTSLNPLITVGRQVSEVLIKHKGMSKKEAKEKTVAMFEKVGIPEAEKRYNVYPHQLSGGLRQRVMIAMALICEPKLLIADEPTTALDVTIAAQILRLMRRLCDETGTSIILITHNMGVVASVCDYVYVMYAGKVVEETDVKNLFDNNRHPYTKGLLKAIPSMDFKADRLYTIKGSVPSLSEERNSCSFCNRCEDAVERCEIQSPAMYETSKTRTHRVRCFLYDKD